MSLRDSEALRALMGALMGTLIGALATGLALAARAQLVEEVPFVTTPDNVTLEMLQLAGVGPRDHVIDLGSGDGRIVIVAAQRFGARGLGVEIDPNLVQRSRDNAARAGVAERAEFREQDLFATDLSPATVVTLYLLPEVNLQLRPKLLALAPGTRIVSHDWDMGDWRPDRSVSVDAPDKKIGREKVSRLHLWVVPARVDGFWCAREGERLHLTQSYQMLRGELVGSGAASGLEGRVDGATLRVRGPRPAATMLAVEGARLRVVTARGAHTPLRGRSFARCD
jgi:SAM-dependent methyltransferase